jgi:hypothetical protein
MSRFSSSYVTSEGVFIMLCDRSCVVNQDAFWDRKMVIAQRAAAVSALVRRKELFVWYLIMDGTFRVDVTVFAAPPSIDGVPFEVNLPTGAVVLRSAPMTVPVISVAPGMYEGRLRWDLTLESEHAGIESAREYPAGAGPDGIISLWMK